MNGDKTVIVGKENFGKTDRAYFRVAREMSKLSDHRQKIGCVLVKNHHIIGSGTNSLSRTDIVQAKLDKERYGIECPGKLHSEADCLIPFFKKRIDISGATLYIYREHCDGSPALARPCVSCMQLIKMCGIKKICYTTYDGFCKEYIEY